MQTPTLVPLLASGLTIPALAPSIRFASTDPLPSWNNTAAKKQIMSFVEKVTTEGSPDFVPIAERIAVFDNDGTLWVEQPIYVQFAFAFDRVKALAPQHPEWKTQEPFASLLKGDFKEALAGGERAVAQIMAASHAGMTTDEFQIIVKEWLRTAVHPRFNRPYNECIYQPMLELLVYLRANDFKAYIASGGGIEFMRAWVENVYGVPPEQVIGSMGELEFQFRGGKPVLLKLPGVDFVDDKAGKPVGIERFIGRTPIAAFGNSDGDQQMLEWTTAGEGPRGPRFALLVHHTDSQREWAYDRNSLVGKLDKALNEANTKGWTVVSMKDDWKTIFPK